MRRLPTTLNTPALDLALTLDCAKTDGPALASGPIIDHVLATMVVTGRELDLIAQSQQTLTFFSSPPLKAFAFTGSHAP